LNEQDEMLIRYDAPIAAVTLNRPDKLNALNQPLVDRLLETFLMLESDPFISIVTLEGAGRSFCAGGDVDVMRKANEQHNLSDVEKVTRTFQDLIALMRKSRLLFISHVHGSAMGGGAGLALACDLVYAVDGSRFGWPYAALGFGPDGGASYELSNALGRYKALETLLFSKQYLAGEMAAKGFINEAVPAEQWEEKKAFVANALRTFPASLLSRLKRLMEAAEAVPPAPSLALEYHTMMATADHPYHKEKVQAFFDRKSERKGNPNG
jgi:enoyl-CoA hydratase/carnithine racemase